MMHDIQSPAELGAVLRAVRKASRVRIDDLALLAHLSKQFVQDVEHGKPTAQIGKALALLQSVGIRLRVEVPPEAAAQVVAALAALTEPGVE
jgi:predicted transcriptional regulator